MDTLTQNYLLPFTPPPVQPWNHESFVQNGIIVDILRLDLIHSVIGGNKWMKLKGFLQQAFRERKKGILTKGGPWSNHIHACAWLCKETNLQCHVWVKGNLKYQTDMLQDIAQWNASLTYVNRADFYNEEKAQLFAAENNLLYIPMGGAEETGVQHITQFMQELCLPQYDIAVCAVGTGTTFGGLAFTSNNFKNIIGVDAGTNDAGVREKIRQWQHLLPNKKLLLLTNYHFGGFARSNSGLIHFMNETFLQETIPTDVVYTGKLLYAVQDLAAKHTFVSGSKILVIHSGGLQGNRSLPTGILQF